MYQIYQIMPDENWDSIAVKFNTTPEDLLSINGLDILLTPGNYIVVPKMDDDFYTRYIVKKGDSLYSIANQVQTNVKVLELLNGLKSNEFIYPEQQIIVPRQGVFTYVTEDETLGSISNKSGIPLDKLVMKNEQLYVQPNQVVVYKVNEK